MDSATKEYLKVLESKIDSGGGGGGVSAITNAEIDTIVAS